MVSNGRGIVGTTNIDNVSVACSANTYTIGVTVAGLIGTGLVLQNNGGGNLSIIASGAMNFSTTVASGSPYNVTVLTQPLGQQCSISSGTGTVGAAPVNVAVSCIPLPDAWTWMGGSSVIGASGVHGTLGSAAAGNVPGARFNAISWADSSGNLWLFGGLGYDSGGNESLLNDLWEYSAGQWKWLRGSNTVNATGTYGIQGVAAAGNAPGARNGAISWTDSTGNFWLFGGTGYDSAGNVGFLNDLWEYGAGQWTWVSGSNTISADGSYGSSRRAM